MTVSSIRWRFFDIVRKEFWKQNGDKKRLTEIFILKIFGISQVPVRYRAGLKGTYF